MRLYRENLALKAQLEALSHLTPRPKLQARGQLRVRTAQAFAYLLTRGNEPFQRYFLSATLGTIQRWATRFRSFRRSRSRGGRPTIDPQLVSLVITLEQENPMWGQRRIQEELRRMGVRLSQPSIQKVLR